MVLSRGEDSDDKKRKIKSELYKRERKQDNKRVANLR